MASEEVCVSELFLNATYFSGYLSYFYLSLLENCIAQLWASGRKSEVQDRRHQLWIPGSLVHLSLILKHQRTRGDYEERAISQKGRLWQINSNSARVEY